MKSISKLLIILAITKSIFAQSGYGFYFITDCDNSYEEQYGSYCLAVVSNVARFDDCSPGRLGGCQKTLFGMDVEDRYSSKFNPMDTRMKLKDSFSKARKERARKIKDYRSKSNYTVKRMYVGEYFEGN